MNDLVKVDSGMDLIEALESRFSLHDVDEIYNLLSEFSVVDTKCGKITFKQWLRRKNG
tara:strand:+ start:469 stop:642 length:174 start_codon:yes stop_codon:yes gene_type:complete